MKCWVLLLSGLQEHPGRRSSTPVLNFFVLEPRCKPRFSIGRRQKPPSPSKSLSLLISAQNYPYHSHLYFILPSGVPRISGWFVYYLLQP